jgi:hypothetical protein
MVLLGTGAGGGGERIVRALRWLGLGLAVIVASCTGSVGPAHAQIPELVIEGAKDGGYAATVAGPAFDVPLRIVSQVDKVVANVRIDVSPLRAPTNASVQTVTVKRDGKEFTPGEQTSVPALGSITLQLSSTVNESGIHRGSVTLIYGGKRFSTSLEVTRERPLPSIKVDPVAGSTTDHIRVALHETAGQPVTLDRPTLLPLVKVIATDASEGAKYRSVDVNVVDGEKETPVGATLAIPPHGTVELLVTVRDLPSQGKFDGTLRLANVGDKGAVETPVTFFRRASTLLAILFLALGVGLAEAMRHAGMRSSRLKARIKVAACRDRLRALRRELAPTPAETQITAVLAELDADIADLYQEAGAGAKSDKDVVTDVQSLDVRIGLARPWAQLTRIAGGQASATVADYLRTACDFIVGGGNEAAATAAKTALDNARTALASMPNAAGAVAATPGVGQPANIAPTTSLERQLKFITALTLLVGSGVAVLIGFLLLYLPNRTWGSPLDMVTMFLWALGVHQVAGVASASSAQALVVKIQEHASASG